MRFRAFQALYRFHRLRDGFLPFEEVKALARKFHSGNEGTVNFSLELGTPEEVEIVKEIFAATPENALNSMGPGMLKMLRVKNKFGIPNRFGSI